VKAKGPVNLGDFRNWWRFVLGRRLAAPPRAQLVHRRPRAASRGARRLRRRGRICALGGQGAPDRGRMGIRGARRPRGRGVRVGRAGGSRLAGRRLAKLLAGVNSPWQNLRSDGYESTSPVGAFPANGYGLFDMTGNVWGMDGPIGTRRATQAYAPKACCIPKKSPRRQRAGQYRSASNRRCRFPRKGHQGRLASVRPQLLRALPAGREVFPKAVETSTCHLGFPLYRPDRSDDARLENKSKNCSAVGRHVRWIGRGLVRRAP